MYFLFLDEPTDLRSLRESEVEGNSIAKPAGSWSSSVSDNESEIRSPVSSASCFQTTWKNSVTCIGNYCIIRKDKTITSTGDMQVLQWSVPVCQQFPLEKNLALVPGLSKSVEFNPSSSSLRRCAPLIGDFAVSEIWTSISVSGPDTALHTSSRNSTPVSCSFGSEDWVQDWSSMISQINFWMCVLFSEASPGINQFLLSWLKIKKFVTSQNLKIAIFFKNSENNCQI